MRDGETPPPRDHADINEVIREVIGLARGEIGRNRVELHTQLSDGLPHVLADRVQLQVMFNLIINSPSSCRCRASTWCARQSLPSAPRCACAASLALAASCPLAPPFRHAAACTRMFQQAPQACAPVAHVPARRSATPPSSGRAAARGRAWGWYR